MARLLHPSGLTGSGSRSRPPEPGPEPPEANDARPELHSDLGQKLTPIAPKPRRVPPRDRTRLSSLNVQNAGFCFDFLQIFAKLFG